MQLIVEKGLKDSLKPEISKLNQALEDLARSSDGFLGDLLSYVLINSGKRVRPALVILGAKFGETDPQHVRIVEMAVELIHIATLIHDDVIDKAALRRGRKTVAHEHGVDTAVLLGDHIYTYAFQKAAELGNPEILRLLAKSTSLMCRGEIDQLKSRYKFTISEQDYFSFIEKKTAALFGSSGRAGAILAGQDLSVQMAVESYGVHLGMAFQITDDLLDLTGEEAVVGKTLRTDLTNGKMTLPLIHYRNQLRTQQDINYLMENLQNPNGHLSDLISQIKNSDSIEYAERVARHHIQEALNQLGHLPAGPARDLMHTLAETLQRRKA